MVGWTSDHPTSYGEGGGGEEVRLAARATTKVQFSTLQSGGLFFWLTVFFPYLRPSSSHTEDFFKFNSKIIVSRRGGKGEKRITFRAGKWRFFFCCGPNVHSAEEGGRGRGPRRKSFLSDFFFQNPPQPRLLLFRRRGGSGTDLEAARPTMQSEEGQQGERLMYAQLAADGLFGSLSLSLPPSLPASRDG